jgi:cytochrome c2
MKNITLYFFLLNFLFSCTNKHDENKNKKLSNLEIKNVVDTLEIDFVSLKAKGLLSKTQIVEVKNDPVYHKTKKFNAIPLNNLLYKYSTLENINLAETKVVFECEDGYKPEMSLAKLLASVSYLAISDAEAPKGREWEQIIKDGHEMKAEPFYIIYEGVSQKDGSYKWPYNLVKIHFAPLHENDGILIPKDKLAMAGYEQYKNRCQTCHAINKIGGNMGPELNYPKSITEYWKKDDLIAFIQNPAAYRYGVKMPNLNVNKDEAEAIVLYLEYMSQHKL